MKENKLISLLLCIVFLFGMLSSVALAAEGNLFTDVKTTDWFYDGVQYAYEHGMMNGTGNDMFSPNATTTRGMIVTILHRLEGTPSANGTAFSDVANGKWYSEAVSWASSKDIVNGYGNGRFGPEDTITREQMAAILYRYAKYKGYDVSASASLSKYTDAAQISSYAIESMIWSNAAELITGTSSTTLSPKGSATRAQVAVILMRFCKSFNSSTDEETITYENGDMVFVPSENNLQFDESESAIYYNNLLLAYTFSDLSTSEAEALATLVNGEVVGRISGAINALQIKVSDSSLASLESMADKLMADGRVMYAGYEYPMQFETSEADSNPWSNNSAQPETDRGNENNPGGNDWWAEAIEAYSAWEYSSKANPIRVGIIDSGFQSNHPDLSGSVYFLEKYNANTEDDHGTHVAGIIGANNNSIGIRGVADQAALYCVDWSPIQGTNYLSNGEYIEITKQLIENNVRVINNSLGNHFMSKDGFTQALYGDSEGLTYILQYLAVHVTGAYDSYVDYINALSKRTALECISIMIQLILNGNEDFIIVQAAGNGYDNGGKGVDTKNGCFYCAIDESIYNILSQSTRDALRRKGISYDSIADRKVIVGAVKNTRNAVGNYQMTTFSNYGANVDICAPGEDIYSTITRSTYKLMSGTSMAAPVVTGSLAYCWSLNPSLTAPEVKSILLSSSSHSAYGVGGGASFTYPMVNVNLAAKAALGIDDVRINYYEVFNNGISSWDAAEAYCESLGGHLATLTSQEENDYVYQIVRNEGYTSAYFGLTDKDNEGTWVWVTGEPVSHTNWHSGEPNHENSNEDYAMFYFKYSDGTWNDGDFGGKTVSGGTAFICEWDTEEAYNAYLRDKDKQIPAYAEHYKLLLQSYPKSTPHTYTIGSERKTFYTDTQYTLYDVDKNGIPELIIREDFSKYHIHTFDDNSTILCGNFYWSYDNCLYEYTGNGLVVHNGGNGYLKLEYVSLYTLVDNILKDKSVIIGTEESSYDELMNYLEKCIPIRDFISITDYSKLS